MIEFNTIYGWIALISTGVIIIQLVFGLFLGDFFDFDADGDVDFDSSTIFSPKGFIHFICGGSWYLVLCEKPYESLDFIIAILIGMALSGMMAAVYYFMHKLSNEIVPETGEDLVGRPGKVYLPRHDGSVDMSLEINGSLQQINVRSKSGKAYRTGDTIVIRSYEDGIYFID